ncbi:hypothetical protein [Agromyces allii]|uniref:Cytochrome P450 n=1 Tax=Agromyces allii TaxID=393607 RepID=A0ABN2RBG2_9MICO|nr:hypothetical protein [Agromyces allii]
MPITITQPSEVRRLLADASLLVPEADAASERASERFRSASSRFVNGAVHDRRRQLIEERLGTLSLPALADTAAALARRARTAPPHVVARTVPVACLATHLGFADPDGLPPLVGAVAAVYPTGEASDEADDAITRLLAAAPAIGSAEAAALDVQLLVQAHLATAALIEGALRTVAGEPSLSTRAALVLALHHAPPVPATRRVHPDGELVVLTLGDPAAAAVDTQGSEDAPLLAFGAGPRACPAPAHALAIASAVVEVLREREASGPPDAEPDDSRGHDEEPDHHRRLRDGRSR